jgi:hypothetical protein
MEAAISSAVASDGNSRTTIASAGRRSAADAYAFR